MRVLMQNRPTTLTQRGGDTIVMERLKRGLEAHGVEVTFDFEGVKNPADYDLVHLFNFVLPDLVRVFAERAHHAGVPYVVTTLNEDVPIFRNQSIVLAEALVEYVERGQDRAWFEAHRPDPATIAPCEKFDNSWVVQHAAALFTNGSRETASLRRDYPVLPRVCEIKLGHEVGAESDPGLFEREYGVRDFVFCVGRFEFRKNQLMLLKALEDSDLTVVLASGGFTYQPRNDRAVRAFRRRGKTLILDKLSAEMLASAYAAARVHALPSWYELPGLVTLEAASHGCQVVATRMGTAPDYLGEEAFYCNPADEDSIRNAVTAAYYAPAGKSLRERSRSVTWERTVQETYDAYTAIIGKKEIHVKQTTAQAAPAVFQGVGFDFASGVNEFQEILERGELAARNKEYNLAHSYLERAQQMNPQSARCVRARGAVYLAENNVAAAEDCFRQALTLNPRDARSLSGMGMCGMNRKQYEDAYGYLVRALELDSEHLVTILQLLECSYTLNRFHDLTAVLERYLERHNDDLDMRYCLAGALFKQGNIDRARRLVQDILGENPGHAGARQLRSAIEEQDRKVMAQPAAPPAAAVSAAPAAEPGPRTAGDKSIGLELARLEEAKRKRDYAAVSAGCAQVLAASELSTEDREWAVCLKAEADVLLGSLQDAEAAFEQVLKANPRSHRALCGQGALAANRGDWQGARHCFEQAREVNPHYDVALAGLGLCCAWLEDPEGAWNFYGRALEANAENGRALLGVLEIGYRLRRLSEVEKFLEAYLDLHPADLEFAYSLAGVYFAQDKLDSAIEAVNRITLFNPSHEQALELKELIDTRRQYHAVK